MNTEHILFLQEIPKTKENIARVGGKAYNLARLSRVGFAVPEGFCLTAGAYHRHLAAHGLTEPIAETLAHPDLSNEDRAAHIRHLITGVDLPLDIHCTVLGAYRKLTGDDPTAAVAVRSSALAEDGTDASFAGQHDTFLNVRGESALIESIKRCWASLWTARSLAYRRRLQVDNPDAALAVIVQRMIPAEQAGVAFTLNPVSGADEILIEAVSGPGEALVAGCVAPQRYRVNKQTWHIEEISAQGKSILNPTQTAEIARLAAEVERLFGRPQDIEWAQKNGHTYLLQSRPVTATAQPGLIDEDGQVNMAALLRRADEMGSEIWTDDNVGEVIPDAVTPLTWSVLEPLGNDAFHSFLRRVGVRRYPAAGLFGHFYRRVYFNQSQFQRLMRRFYPSHLGQIDGGRSRLLGFVRAATALAETGLRSLMLIPRLPRQARGLVAAAPGELRHAPLPQTLSDEALWAETERWQTIGQQVMALHLTVTVFASLLYSLLEKQVSRWSNGRVQAAWLVAGLPGMKSAAMGRDLAALAAEIADDADLVTDLLAASPQALTEWASSLPADHRFSRALERFLSRHGHASFREFELAFPRWREDPGHVLVMLQNHLRGHGGSGPDGSSKTQEAMRQRAAQALRRQLRWNTRRPFFEILLRWTRRYSVARENLKYTFVMLHGRQRQLYLTLADRLVERGALAETDDLFYLTRPEVHALLAGRQNRETINATIDQRRADYVRHQDAQAPKIIEQWPDGSLRPLAGPHHQGAPETVEGMEETEKEAFTLRGVAASAGQATGRARVILDPSNSAQLERGEILVALSTNPAWAPLLLNAGGLITEVGGLLSHGAIVAREYGLPAVLNVKGATQAIRTGQRLAIDGFAGTVQVWDDDA